MHVYKHRGLLKVETLVVNIDGKYQDHHRNEETDLLLEDYARDTFGNQGTECEELLVINIPREDATISFAETTFPINKDDDETFSNGDIELSDSIPGHS